MTTNNEKPKLNSRQHLVLINALKGMNQTDAYNAVYGKTIGSYQRASELFRKAEFKAELEKHLNGQLAKVEATVLSKGEKRQILANIARAQLADLLDEAGEPKLNKNSPAMLALKEWYHRQRVDNNGNPIITKSVKLLDPIAAIAEDNKMVGDYAPNKHLVGQAIKVEIAFVDKRKELPEGEQ